MTGTDAVFPSVLVVIVNYRTAGLTIDCLRSLEPEVAGHPQVRVVVTDNASGDDSTARIATAIAENGWGSWVQLQPLDRNGGFAFGNNAAIVPALQSENPPQYVWMLNPDTVVHPGALAALVGFMDENPRVGLAGSRMEDPDGTAQCSAFRFPSVLGELNEGMRLGVVSKLLARWVKPPFAPAVRRPVDWVAGASLIVRREVFEAIGPLDEGYFMYFEEVDFCLHAHRAGWPCWYVPESRVVHLVGQSSGVTDLGTASRKRRPTYWFDARKRYFVRNHGRFKKVLADVAWASAFATYRVRQKLQSKPNTDPVRLWRDFFRYNFLPERR